MKRALPGALAIAGWCLIYSPATLKGDPDSQASLSNWEIDGSYGTAGDCDAAHRSDLNSMLGLEENSRVPMLLRDSARRGSSDAIHGSGSV